MQLWWCINDTSEYKISNLWALLAGMALLWQAGTGGHHCFHAGEVAVLWTGLDRCQLGVSPASSTREFKAPGPWLITHQVLTDSNWPVPVSPSLDWNPLPHISGCIFGILVQRHDEMINSSGYVTSHLIWGLDFGCSTLRKVGSVTWFNLSFCLNYE